MFGQRESMGSHGASPRRVMRDTSVGPKDEVDIETGKIILADYDG
jgi:hypothetical protein